MKLSKSDKKVLLQNGYEPEDLQQIQDAVNLSKYRLYDSFNNNNYGIGISAEEAYELLGQETFLSGIGRSTFHWSASRDIDGTNRRYNVHFDSGEMFGGKPCNYIDYKELSINDVKSWKKELENKKLSYSELESLVIGAIEWAIDRSEQLTNDLLRGMDITPEGLEAIGYDRDNFPSLYEAIEEDSKEKERDDR